MNLSPDIGNLHPSPLPTIIRSPVRSHPYAKGMATRSTRTTGGSRAPSESRPEPPATPQLASTELGPTLGDIYSLLQHLNRKVSALEEHVTIIKNMFVEQEESLSKLKSKATETTSWIRSTQAALEKLQGTVENQQGPQTPKTIPQQMDADPTPQPTTSTYPTCPAVRVESPRQSRSRETKPLAAFRYRTRESRSPSPLGPPPQITRGLSHTPGGTLKPKVKEPEHFDGSKGKKAADWLLWVGLWAQFTRDTFEDKQSQVTYILGMTKDKAADWARPHISRALRRQPGALRKIREFSKAFAQAFEDPDVKRLAAQKINKLTQTSNVESYITEFENLQYELEWNKEALQSAFERGLHWKVKETLSQVYPAPPNFEEVKKHARRINAIRQENEASRPPRPQPSKKPSATATTTTKTTTTKVALTESPNYISPEEREERRKLKLCIKCGSPDHIFRDCKKGWSKERVANKGKKKEETAKIAKAESEPKSSSEN